MISSSTMQSAMDLTYSTKIGKVYGTFTPTIGVGATLTNRPNLFNDVYKQRLIARALVVAKQALVVDTSAPAVVKSLAERILTGVSGFIGEVGAQIKAVQAARAELGIRLG
jgi:hypothetical protein